MTGLMGVMFPLWAVCDGRVTMVGSFSVLSPSLRLRRENQEALTSKDSSENKAISPKQEVLLTGRTKAGRRPDQVNTHTSSMLLVGGGGGEG